MHKDTQVQGTELGQEGREGSFALAGFPTDQARATLEPNGPKMLNRWDGSVCWETDGRHIVGRDEVYFELGKSIQVGVQPWGFWQEPVVS